MSIQTLDKDDIIVLNDGKSYLITQIVAFDNDEYLLCVEVNEATEEILKNGKVLKRENELLQNVTDETELINLGKFLNIDLKNM